MKKIKSLGKTLNREEQKRITGGHNYELFCYPRGGGALVNLGTHSGTGDCTTHLNSVCTPSGSYDSCVCAPGTIYQACDPA